MNNPTSMHQRVEDYLTQRRNLGYELKIEGEELLRFAQYADHWGEGDPLSVDLAVRWAKLPQDADPIYWARRLDTVRRFAKWRAVFDPSTQIPPEGYLGPSYRRTTPPTSTPTRRSRHFWSKPPRSVPKVDYVPQPT